MRIFTEDQLPVYVNNALPNKEILGGYKVEGGYHVYYMDDDLQLGIIIRGKGLVKSLPTRQSYQGKLELHANRLEWELNNPNITEYDIQETVELTCEAFKQETGVEIQLLGRSGRHVCIEPTIENILNYESLREKALTMYNNMVKFLNEYKPE